MLKAKVLPFPTSRLLCTARCRNKVFGQQLIWEEGLLNSPTFIMPDVSLFILKPGLKMS